LRLQSKGPGNACTGKRACVHLSILCLFTDIMTDRTTFPRINSANSYGDCLITVSTSKELTEEKAAEVGLFTAHAYAVLGVIQTTNGTRLLQLKNPWASQVRSRVKLLTRLILARNF